MNKLNIRPVREMILVRDGVHDRMVSVDHKAFYDNLIPEGYFMCEYSEFVRCPNPELDGLKVIKHVFHPDNMKDITDPTVWNKLMDDTDFLIYPAGTSRYGRHMVHTMDVCVSNPIPMSLVHQIDPSILYIKPDAAIRLGVDKDGDILSLGIKSLPDTPNVPDDLVDVCESICQNMINNPDVEPVAYSGTGDNHMIVFTYKGEYREFKYNSMMYVYIFLNHSDDMKDFIK